MTTYKGGSIVVVDFPATSGQLGKRRPAVVVFDSGDADVVVASLTTKARQSGHDVALSDWAGAGLRAPSTLRIHKMLTVEKSLVRQTMGALTAKDHEAVAKVLNSMFASW